MDTATEIAMRNAPTRAENWYERLAAYQQGIRPILAQKAAIYAHKLPEITISPDGTMTSEYKWTPLEQSILDQLDEVILQVAKQCGLVPSPPPAD